MNIDVVTAGIVLSIAGIAVASLRSIPGIILEKIKQRFIYSVKIYQHDLLFELVEKYMFDNNSHVYRNVEATIDNPERNVGGPKPSTEMTKYHVRYKQEDNMFIVKINGKRLFIRKGKIELKNTQYSNLLFARHYIISGWMAKKVINELLTGIVNDYNASLKESINIYSNTIFGEWTRVNELTVKPLSKIVIDPQVKKLITDDIETFVTDHQWYIDRNIPYKRTYCLHGLPGNGKTTIALSMAQHLKRHVYTMQLNTFDKDDCMIRSFGYIPENSVLLIEDIDSAFVQRENKTTSISFSALLNCMDGAMCKEGTVCIITTNHIDKLDAALLRAGRTDIVQEIKPPTEALIREYFNLFFGVLYKGVPAADKSMSQVQEICIRNRYDMEKCIEELK